MSGSRLLIALAVLSLACAPVCGETTKTSEAGKPSHAGTTAGKGESRFERFDKNGDGKWSKEELQADREDRFKSIDTNKDAKLTTDELAAEWVRYRAVMDKDKDGKVTLEEFMLYYVPKMPGPGVRQFPTLDGPDKDGIVTEDEAAGFYLWRFERADVNKDGVLTMDEMNRVTQDYIKDNDKNGDGVIDITEVP